MSFTPDEPTKPFTQENIEEKQSPPKKKASWDPFFRTIIYAVVIAVVFRSFFFEPFHIPSGSMKNNLLVGDYLFVSKFSYGYSRYSFPLGFPLFEGRALSDDRPERGDVVVFRLPRNPRVDFIKRVIGLPGDRIQVKKGTLYINGKAAVDEYLDDYLDNDKVENTNKRIPRYRETLPDGTMFTVLKERDDGFANNTPLYVVPPKHYFMMGDNRDNSRDSRFQDEVGFVPEENLVGRADLIFFSTEGNVRFYEIWNWISALRGSRFFKVIH